ncbi:hypothetical protein [Olsenella uli]|uniref:hypothetical protein n=1 Tax=Olsenella uli TaxID=133926 RepID=UPI000450FDED|nr:hypothetical protein [Olsenella uli]EUB30533.1 hypothetical protein HMPREF1503_0744 [Olsenella uli MSTE5]
MVGTTTDRKAQTARERDALIAEADLQTRAIMRLSAWKRIAYSLLAVGALMAYWNIYQEGPFWALVVGIVTFIASVFASVMLYMVVERAKANVRAMMSAAGIDMGDAPKGGSVGKG